MDRPTTSAGRSTKDTLPRGPKHTVAGGRTSVSAPLGAPPQVTDPMGSRRPWIGQQPAAGHPTKDTLTQGPNHRVAGGRTSVSAPLDARPQHPRHRPRAGVHPVLLHPVGGEGPRRGDEGATRAACFVSHPDKPPGPFALTPTHSHSHPGSASRASFRGRGGDARRCRWASRRSDSPTDTRSVGSGATVRRAVDPRFFDEQADKPVPQPRGSLCPLRWAPVRGSPTRWAAKDHGSSNSPTAGHSTETPVRKGPTTGWRGPCGAVSGGRGLGVTIQADGLPIGAWVCGGMSSGADTEVRPPATRWPGPCGAVCGGRGLGFSDPRFPANQHSVSVRCRSSGADTEVRPPATRWLGPCGAWCGGRGLGVTMQGVGGPWSGVCSIQVQRSGHGGPPPRHPWVGPTRRGVWRTRIGGFDAGGWAVPGIGLGRLSHFPALPAARPAGAIDG
jgi:hypothetical protein